MEEQDTRSLYPAKEEPGLEVLPEQGVETAGQPLVRTHGAIALGEGVFFWGYALSAVLIFVALGAIAFAKGPRKKDALQRLWDLKVMHAKKS